ncbi:cytochrome P450 6B6-like [Helicoverpa zea]|uniref:cytochrome P450 6B6-like n=1 Tax=Helicoverpa zea TaxID=7113 RepID=UPI001F59DC20|nr:cytochrome P450 6B6-like [Helicoverpa zea]XP_049699582.1 cytochrome P450 6B6-like [Helicoverpa armigera]WRX05920.1 CYP6AB9 [Helicoverpa armigera]
MITLAIIVVLLISLYLYGTKNFKYWEKRGIKHDKPLPLFGNNIKGYFFYSSMTQVADELYWKYPNERVVGFFRASEPELLIRDPEIAKRLLSNDFSHFFQRGFTPNKTVFEPMMQNLFFAEGDLWKLLRQRMTPAFTSGKLKAMFPLIVERAERLKTRALAAAADGKSLDARDLMARYTTDFIGACGFGLDADTLNDENSPFRQLGINIFKLKPIELAKIVVKEMFPDLCQNVKIWTRVEKDINELVGEIMAKRNNEPSGRGDFIDLMLECKMKGTVVGESIESRKPDGSPETASLEFNDGIIAAQVFVFFAAGFETSSSATSFTLHQLAYHPEVQKKAQEEVDRILAKHDGKLSYDSIKEMNYLEMAFKEGLRMFPSLGFLLRQCTRPYTFPEFNMTIDETCKILIPLQSLHNDPKYFPNPEEFRPERFSPEEFDSNNKFVYLPFGLGPRACIGERLGLMQSLAGLAAVLSEFTVEPAPETLRYPVVDPQSSIVQSVQGGLPLMFRPRKKLA